MEGGSHAGADAERSRRRILDAARDVFLERGLDAPLDLIVRRAGVGPGHALPSLRRPRDTRA
ncbi:TetR/AcrR family transcriptional regulator [Streptomyces sp. NBC_00984]|nr:TetR/AcrR family transcriptional regulator [Streptomyces sp. NBC_00984]